MAISMEDVLKNATELKGEKPTLPKESNMVEEQPKQPYDGPGMVVDKVDAQPEEQKVGLTPSALDRVKKHLDETDELIEYMRDNASEEAKRNEERINNDYNGVEDEKPLKENEIQKLVAEKQRHELQFEGMSEEEKETEEIKQEEIVKVIIDKTGLGRVIDFTEEERAKLEKSKVIKLEEIENVQLDVKKTKKLVDGSNRKKLSKLLERKAIPYTTQMIAPSSGYTATIKACSTYELLSLILAEQAEEDPVISQEKKWSVIYNKIVDTSIGKMSFDMFMHNTSHLDYKMFIYSILTATYGAQKKNIPFDCEACGTSFEAPLDTKAILRTEKMGDRMLQLIAKAVDNSHVKEDAENYHRNLAPVTQTKLIKLPFSQYIIELQVQSVYDNIHKSLEIIKDLADKDKIKAQLALLASTIAKILIDDEETGDRYEITDNEDIIEVLYSLQDDDMAIVTQQAGDMIDGLDDIQFGIKNLVCPKCGKVTPFVPLDIESLLFFLSQESNTTTVRE